ncbi:MAG TPA: NAD(P)-dependent alcohol dehydrogenase [Pseudolysinimonas sp.]|nr:NAD(P)-dependent alcohol dehydrogenase [Pseudolysinimonas sp.]
MTTSSNTSPRLYDIRIGGHLDPRWAASFDGASISTDPDGTTVLRGVFADQAALHGLLGRLRDTGLPLLGITQVGDAGGLMRAAVYRRFGGPEVVGIHDVERPQPAAGQLLVRVHASTVSAADHRTRARDVPAGLLLPSSLVLGFFRPRRPILGMDAAGVVVAVGAGVETFAPGDEVVAMLGSRFGGHAEYAIVAAGDAVAAKPSQLSFGEAVSLVFGGITAQAYLRQAQIGPETRVLVNGASGAVGTAMVQLAKAAGAHVTAVASAPNHPLVLSLGADRVIDYAIEDFAADGSHYDVIADCVGNAPVARIAGSLAPGGTVLVVAGDLRAIAGAKRDERRHGITVITGPGSYRSADLVHVVELADRGLLRPVIDRTFGFEQIVAAHRLVDSGRKRGSVVVTLEH